MKHHFIINPAAGRGTLVHSLAEKVTERCLARGTDFTVYETKAPGDAILYVRSSLAAEEGRHRFYACGGDGTLSEVVNGAPTDPRCEFGLIPIGTGNDFCRNFDDRGAFFDIDRQLDGSPLRIDLIRYNDRYCVNMLNIGFDCNVVFATAKLKRKWYVPEGMAYMSGVAVTLFQKMTTHMHIELGEDEVIERPLLLITLANGRCCVGGFRSNPLAALNDGLFDVNIVEKMSRITFLSLIGSYKAGTHLEQGANRITYRQTPRAFLRFGHEIPICVDGEVEYAERLEVSLVPAAADFILPAGVRCVSLAAEEGGGEVPPTTAP